MVQQSRSSSPRICEREAGVLAQGGAFCLLEIIEYFPGRSELQWVNNVSPMQDVRSIYKCTLKDNNASSGSFCFVFLSPFVLYHKIKYWMT